jgi:hypothetical protein
MGDRAPTEANVVRMADGGREPAAPPGSQTLNSPARAADEPLVSTRPENPLVPLHAPLGPPPGGDGAGRGFLIARFAAYALIVALGSFYLLNRDSAQGQDVPEGRWVQGETTQRLPVSVKVHEGRVVAVEADWRASCSAGGTVEPHAGFQDAFKGDFERDGTRFADDWTDQHEWGRGVSGELEAHLEGEASGAVARGSMRFKLTASEDGEPYSTCESGPIGFAVDLPG